METLLSHIFAAREARSVLRKPRNADEWRRAASTFRSEVVSALDVLREAGAGTEGYLDWLGSESAGLTRGLGDLRPSDGPMGAFIAPRITVWDAAPAGSTLRITPSGIRYVDEHGAPIQGALSSISGDYGFASAGGTGDETAMIASACLEHLERLAAQSQDRWKLDLGYIEPPVFDSFDEFPLMDAASAQKAICSSAAMWTAQVLGERFLERQLAGMNPHPAAVLYRGLVVMASGAPIAESGLSPVDAVFALLFAAALRGVAQDSALEEAFHGQLKGQADAFFDLAYQVQLAWSLCMKGFVARMIPPEGVGRPDIRGEKDGFVVEIEAKRCANSRWIVRNAFSRSTRKEYRGSLNGVFIEVLNGGQVPDAEGRLRRRLQSWDSARDGQLPLDFVGLTWLDVMEPAPGCMWVARRTVCLDRLGSRLTEGLASELGGVTIGVVTRQPDSLGA